MLVRLMCILVVKGKYMKRVLIILLVASNAVCGHYWQQEVKYKMNVKLDVETNRFTGVSTLIYQNNSPDTLNKVFFHLYFNAFQPGSMMDVRSRNISDPDDRVMDRISKLKPDEYGEQHIGFMTLNNDTVSFQEVGTILEVTLPKPILPGKAAEFKYSFKGQVPLQIRRSGRDNKEGIRYSMSQWYPKICEYDRMGWHSNPYVGREFHGVWGSFDVSLTLDSSYMVAATGVLQNPSEIGKGYTMEKVVLPNSEELTWHFKADMVHDFVWAADPDYKHTQVQVPDGPLVHMFYQPGEKTNEAWEALPNYVIKLFQFANKNFGKYPFPSYSIIQGGDGGMEYPMATLVTGERSKRSLAGVCIHEVYHSWFQCVLATNESLYPWMDEGFTTYASSRTVAYIFNRDENEVQQGSYKGYYKIVEMGIEEPLTTHADHFEYNMVYGVSSYSKGAMFLNQLSYIMGQEVFNKGMLRYFNEWKFKHPDPVDFIRVMEKTSGMELDWFLLEWIETTKHIDYAIQSVDKKKGNTVVTLKRKGTAFMPVELWVTLKDSSKEVHYIAPTVLRAEKQNEYKDVKWIVEKDWPWTNPTYTIMIPHKPNEIERMEFDRYHKVADIHADDNIYPQADANKE